MEIDLVKVDLVKENIKMEQNIGDVNTQILMEGDVIVPDINPDILEILEHDTSIVVEKINITENRINYIGKIDVQILYLAKGETGGIHSMNSIIPIDEIINIDGINENMWADVKLSIENIDYSILNDRKISIRAIVNVSGCGTKVEEVEFVVDTNDLLAKQIKKSNICVNKMIDRVADRFIVKDQIMVSKASPNIKNILRKDAKIINQDFKCANGKVFVSADVLVTILYKGDSNESIIEIVEKEISFNGYIEVRDATEDMHALVDLHISEFVEEIKTDEDQEERIIDVEISIQANCKVSTEEEISVLEDGYIIGKELVLEKKEINYPKLICRNKNQSTIKDVIQVDGKDVLQVFKVNATTAIEDTVIQEDRLILEGIINVSVLYIAQSDDSPLCAYKTIIPFRQIIEVRGATDKMTKKVSSFVDHISFNMLSDKEIELRILVSCDAEVIEINKKNIVVDAQIFDKSKEVIESMPSMAIYVVQKGDTLWDIAKRYNTDIDDIVEINNIENPDIIFEGQKLLIIKKIIL